MSLAFVALLVGGCVARSRLDLGAVTSRSQTPAIVEQTMVRFDAEGHRNFPRPDNGIIGHWMNRVGFGQTVPIVRIYSTDGTWAAEDGAGDFVTLRANGLSWIYEVARSADEGVAGRSLRIYAIDGDQMLARYQNPQTGWEFWERVNTQTASGDRSLSPLPKDGVSQ